MFISLFFSSCVKDEFYKPPLNFSKTTTESIDEIKDWLDEQGDSSRPRTNEFISLIKINAEFENMYYEEYGDDQTLLIIPIRSIYFSQNIEHGKTPLQFLIIRENNEGLILRGDFVLFYPNDPNIISLPERSFERFFTAHKSEQNGRFVLLTFADRKIAEYEIINDALQSVTFLTAENAVEFGSPTGCIQYTVVRLYFDLSTGEILDYDIIWEGTICNNNCLPWESFCDEQGGGGTSTEQEPEPCSVDVIFLVRELFEGGLRGSIIAKYTLHGMKYPNNPALNYFTAIDKNGESYLTYLGSPSLNDNYSTSYHPWWAIYREISNTFALNGDNKRASAVVAGSLEYPNQSGYIPGNPPKAFSNYTNWLASTALK